MVPPHYANFLAHELTCRHTSGGVDGFKVNDLSMKPTLEDRHLLSMEDGPEGYLKTMFQRMV